MTKLSIITAVGRNEPYLFETAKSVKKLFDRAKAQYPDFYGEWVVSCDNVDVNEVIKTTGIFQRDHHVHILGSSKPRQLGPARTRNRGLKMAAGDIVGCLDSDDWYNVDGMLTMVDIMITIPQLAWVAGRVTDIDEAGETLYVDNEIGNSGSVPKGWVEEWVSTRGYFPFSACATLARKNAIEEVGGWDTSKRFIRAEDLALWTRITNNHDGFWLDEAVYYYRKHPGMLHQNPLWRREDSTLKDNILHYLNKTNEGIEDFADDLESIEQF